MSVTKVLFLLSAAGVFAESCFCQTFVGTNFDQLAAPSGCIRNATVPPTSATRIPALNLPGVTVSGGQVLSYANQFQTSNNVYYTFNGCAGVLPAITITFQGPASNVNMVIGQFWASYESVQVQDDAGDNLTFALPASSAGQSLFLPGTNIHTITITLPNSVWTQGSPAGFYIDNLDCYINNGLNFVDPVPELVTGTGVVNDPESLATLGTLVRAVSADGVARVLLTAQATRVGEIMTLSVINDQGVASNSIQQDGGLSPVAGSAPAKQQS